MVWGYLRETEEYAIKAGADLDTGLIRTGLDTYLKEIFPETNDWVHDKTTGFILNGRKMKTRPDYLSESLKLIVEYDGIQHFQSPTAILHDDSTSTAYVSFGYKVVRIPYFIQLTEDAIFKFFGVHVGHPMFDPSVPSFGLKEKNTPAFLTMAGIEKMAEYFNMFPDQYETNVRALESIGDDYLSGLSLLKNAMQK